MAVAKILLLFWASYFSLIFLTNLFDVLKRLNVLPSSWKFESGNYEYFVRITSVFRLPSLFLNLLFFFMLIIEGITAVFFWRANLSFRDSLNETVYIPFALGIFLFSGFVLMDEVFISYVPEATHYRIFIALIVSLIILLLLLNYP